MSINLEDKTITRDFPNMGPTRMIIFNDIYKITLGGQYAFIYGNQPEDGEQELWLHAETNNEINKLKELMESLGFNGAITYERS